MSPRRSRAAVAALAAAALLLAPATASAETWVSFPALLRQVRTGDLIRAIINPTRGDVEIKFRNLSEWHAYYPPGEQQELQRLLRARHVRTLFVPRHPRARAVAHATVHHHLRYIAAGVLAAVLLAAGALLLLRRRSARRGIGPS